MPPKCQENNCTIAYKEFKSGIEDFEPERVDWLLETCIRKKEHRGSNEVGLIMGERTGSQVRWPLEFEWMWPSMPLGERASTVMVPFEALRVILSVQAAVRITLRMWILLWQGPEPESWYCLEQMLKRWPSEMWQGHPAVLLVPQHNEAISRLLLSNE